MNKTKRFYFIGQPTDLCYIDVDYIVEQAEKFNITFKVELRSPSQETLNSYSACVHDREIWRLMADAANDVGEKGEWKYAELLKGHACKLYKLESNNTDRLETAYQEGLLIFGCVCDKVAQYAENFKENYDNYKALSAWLQSKKDEYPENNENLNNAIRYLHENTK